METASLVKVQPEVARAGGRAHLFISYSRQGLFLEPLLEALLEAHDIRFSSAMTDVERDARLEQRVERSILEADAVVLIVGRSSVVPPWMASHLAAFRVTKPDAPVVPVLLDSFDVELLLPSLAQLPSADFSECLLSGFQTLFAILGAQFLSREDLSNRRGKRSRRSERDRRVSDAQNRMQTGFLLAYCRATERTVFEKHDVSLRELTLLTTALQEEAERYEYFDRGDGARVDPLEVLDRAVLATWQSLEDPADQEIVKVLKGIATVICARYKVKTVDRRGEDRRAHAVLEPRPVGSEDEPS